MSLRLGYHYHVPAYTVQDGNLYMPGYLGRFVDSLAEYCRSVTCFLHSPPPEEQPMMDYAIRSPNVTWVDLGRHTSVPKRMLRAHQTSRLVRARLGDLDAMLIRGPSPLLPAVANACGSLPLALLLVGDYVAGLDDLRQPAWRMALIRAWSHWNKAQQLNVASRSLVFVNSHKLYEELQPVVPQLVETRTTTLYEKDIYLRDDTCEKLPYRLLYTGRITLDKGIGDLVEALVILIHQGLDVVLDLVGWCDKDDNFLNEILTFAQDNGLLDRIKYYGYQPVGPKLFAYYERADVYVMPSRTQSEGFPRTIWEAMAHSLPVVATSVGSIPAFLDGAAILVTPYDVVELAEAIRLLLHDQTLRQELIRLGLELARQNTLERRSREIILNIQNWIDSRNQIK